MADSIRDLFFGAPARELVEAVEPQRTFDDVVLPERTLRALDHALALVRKHDLIFRQWGLAERHTTGLGLAFHFAGPPGTGKTICAEALAYTLDRKLLVVRYSELESRWVGQTAKHVASVFRAAERQDAVLFFDEADAIAGRRFTTMQAAVEREANSVVNVLLHELETFPGVVIFATNLAANMDPAFERRIRTHILFEMPDVDGARADLARAAPPAEDAARRRRGFPRAGRGAIPRSGGDIKNAVLKAAQIATTEPGPDAGQADPPAALRAGDGGGRRGHVGHGPVAVRRERRPRPPAAFARGDVRGPGGAPRRAGPDGERLDGLERRQAGACRSSMSARPPRSPRRAEAELVAAAKRAKSRILWIAAAAGPGARHRALLVTFSPDRLTA